MFGNQSTDRVSVEEAGPLDRDGIPWWFPQIHPQTGARLTPQARQEWFLNCLKSQMSRELVEGNQPSSRPSNPPQSSGQSPAPMSPAVSPSSDSEMRLQLEILQSLLFMKDAVDRDYLPTPEQS